MNIQQMSNWAVTQDWPHGSGHATDQWPPTTLHWSNFSIAVLSAYELIYTTFYHTCCKV